MNLDTIAAFSTPPGESGLAVFRISGPQAAAICDRLFTPYGSRFPLPSKMEGYSMAPGIWAGVDEVILSAFRAPHSYTGEDVYEVSCHGGQAIRQAVMDSALAAGARPAGPGEFSRRAFINGKMDLSSAEAVMDMISAQAEAQARVAFRQLRGALSQTIRRRIDQLYGALAHLEMLLDWDEEEERPQDRQAIMAQLEEAQDDLKALAHTFESGRVIREGLSVVIAGSPNVGKSSILNALAERDRAIVSPIPGTTRDTVDIDLTLGGYLVHLTDTAGLAHESPDPIEREGIVRAEKALDEADLVLWVLSPPLPPPLIRQAEEARIDGLLQAGRPVILILGKDDLRPSLPPQEDPVHYAAARFPQVPTLTWSERQEADLARLRQTLIDHIEKDQVPASPDQTEDRLVEEKEGQALLTHARHKSAIDRAIQLVDKAREDLARQWSFDLVAISLKEALTELSAITGDDVSETLIEEIFNRFCIGK
ncbi:MAG TPA: tRNA uridine-5-carboxymethylaminomethyl(34) synthesis GTPase MnmE [Clostridia bacterium]|nr:tRNA uridine-5-carboxymethylaminomethyl(34) synthesis GTPase MnmE [Clostridia bacterium]